MPRSGHGHNPWHSDKISRTFGGDQPSRGLKIIYSLKVKVKGMLEVKVRVKV